MKKIIYLTLFTLIFSLFGINFVNASTSPELVGTIDNCRAYAVSEINSGVTYASGQQVLVYSVTSGSTYNFTFVSGSKFILFGSNDLVSSCSTSMLDREIIYKSSFSPDSNTDYEFTINRSYIYINTDGTFNWLGQVPEPEPEPLTFDDLIYVPLDSTYNKCYVVQSEGVIRGYDIIPALSTNYNYRDYYIKSSYIYKDGSGSWSQYSTLPICLDSEKLTNDFYYRLDFDKICIVFITLVLFGILLPIKIFSKILLGKGGL